MYALRFGSVCHLSSWGKKIFTLIHIENSDELERFYKLDIMVCSMFGLLLEYLKFSLKQLVSGLFDKLKIAHQIC